MRITDVTYSEDAVDHMTEKHNVDPYEVDSCFYGDTKRKIRKARNGRYHMFAQTDAGRYLFIVYELYGTIAEVVTARDMEFNERRYFRTK